MTIGRLLVVAAVLAPAQCAAQPSSPSHDGSIAGAVATITEDDFARKVGVIAHDSMAGRDTPSAGLDATAAWIAEEFRRLGLRGGAEDGGFIQRYPVRSVALDPTASSVTAGAVTLAYGPDVLPFRGEPESVDATAEVVIVSGTDRFGRSAAAGVEGRHAVVVPDVERGSGVLQIVRAVVDAGAASVWVATEASDEVWREAEARAFEPAVSKGWGDGLSSAPSPLGPATVRVRAGALSRLLAGHEVDLHALATRTGRPIRVDRIEGLRTRLVQTVVDRGVTAPNVVGILPGSDPDLRGEHVVFSAHIDHVGIGAPDRRGDSIYNGADDDASGTVAVMEVAEAMAGLATAPRRSMIFLLVSGEERGLWGSEWYADHPSVPVDRLVADLNADMVGRNWTDTIVAIGKEHSNLGETLNAVNALHPELGMTAIDDPWPEESFYFRSDHFNFARKGVPILFFFNGTHEDYHAPDDEPDRIDAEKAARIARLLFHLGMEVGDSEHRPAWNPESYRSIVGSR